MLVQVKPAAARAIHSLEVTNKQQQPHTNNTNTTTIDTTMNSKMQQLWPMKKHIARVIQDHFPMQHIAITIAYGSGVFRQESNEESNKKMIDLIFAVEDSYAFHLENLARNPDHYASVMGFMGAARVTSLQKNFGAKIYYHPFVRLSDPRGISVEGNGNVREFKYGVIDVEDMIQDLESWTTLYCAGRLQKPVLFFDHGGAVRCAGEKDDQYARDVKSIGGMENGVEDYDLLESELSELGYDVDRRKLQKRFVHAQQYNLRSAFRTALLLLPEKFTRRDLYEKITSLSYMGDVRMRMGGLGEDANKIRKIVSNNMSYFDTLYVPLLEGQTRGQVAHLAKSWETIGDADSALWCQDMSDDARVQLVLALPSNMRHHMQAIYCDKYLNEYLDTVNSTSMREIEIAKMIIHKTTVNQQHDLIARALHNIVHQTSFEQTAKGVLTAGVGRSLRYVREKFNKALTSKKE